MRNTVVVSTFSVEGWEQYGRRMAETFEQFWPRDVRLVLYPDGLIEGVPVSNRIWADYAPLADRDAFKAKWRDVPKANGITDAGYNYRFDAVKFSNKPFVLADFLRRKHRLCGQVDSLIWMDADTLTHAPISMSVVNKEMCPKEHAGMYLGRSYKYSECGWIYFNLREEIALKCIEDWANLYASGDFTALPEWHDSYLFDCVRATLETDHPDAPSFKNLTGHLTRKNGAGHPFVNSFLGNYMDHLKGETRKRTGKPSPKDLMQPNDAPYWRDRT